MEQEILRNIVKEGNEKTRLFPERKIDVEDHYRLIEEIFGGHPNRQVYTLQFASFPEKYFKGNNVFFLRQKLYGTVPHLNDLTISIKPYQIQFSTIKCKLSDEKLDDIRNQIINFLNTISPTNYKLRLVLKKEIDPDFLDRALFLASTQAGFLIGPIDLFWDNGILTFETLSILTREQWEYFKSLFENCLDLLPGETIEEVEAPILLTSHPFLGLKRQKCCR